MIHQLQPISVDQIVRPVSGIEFVDIVNIDGSGSAANVKVRARAVEDEPPLARAGCWFGLPPHPGEPRLFWRPLRSSASLYPET